jgi:hypothetical protein
MEAITFIVLALAVFALLAILDGSDSRPVDDVRPWWPGTRDDAAAYPQHKA